MKSTRAIRVLRRPQHATSPTLSVITVVKNDVDGLEETGASVGLLVPHADREWIVWINAHSLDVDAHVAVAERYADVIVLGSDSGIFDAMNSALDFAKGEFVQFINAKDIILKPFDIHGLNKPCLVPVVYRDYFGRTRMVGRRKSMKFGIPFCHQGMILPRRGYQFDISLKYGADYLALIQMNLPWPLPIFENGLVQYDTTGVSTMNRWVSDKWTAKIISNEFGFFYAAIYICKCLAKLAIKRIYKVVRR